MRTYFNKIDYQNDSYIGDIFNSSAFKLKNHFWFGLDMSEAFLVLVLLNLRTPLVWP